MLAVVTSPFAVGFLSRVLLQVVAFVQIIVAAKYLDLTAFGTYALAWAIAVISISFVYTGFYQALLRSENFEGDRDTAFAAMACIGIGGASVLLAVSAIITASGGDNALVFLLFSVLPLARVLIAWNEVALVRQKSIRTVSISPAASECTALAVIWIGLQAGMGLYSLVLGRFIVLFIEAAIILGAARSLPGRTVNWQSFRSLRTSAFPLWGTSALGMFSIYGADLILGAFLSPAAVGAYRAGARVSQTATDLVAQPLNLLSWSRFTSLRRDNQTHLLKSAWVENMALAIALLWPVLTLVCLVAEPLIIILFDEAWLPVVSIMIVLAVSRGIRFISSLLEPTMTSLDRGGDQLRVRLLGGLVLLIGLLTFGRTSVELAPYAHLLASVAVAVYALKVLWQALSLGVVDLVRCFWPGLALSLATAGVVLWDDATFGAPITALQLVRTVGIWALAWGVLMGLLLLAGRLHLPKP